MQLRSIALTVLVIGIAWYWVKAREVKDFALRAAARYCNDLSLQLLDQTVSLKGLRIGRNTADSLCLVRTFHFEFTSTGEDRYPGQIVIEGRKVASIKLAPHRID